MRLSSYNMPSNAKPGALFKSVADYNKTINKAGFRLEIWNEEMITLFPKRGSVAAAILGLDFELESKNLSDLINFLNGFGCVLSSLERAANIDKEHIKEEISKKETMEALMTPADDEEDDDY